MTTITKKPRVNKKMKNALPPNADIASIAGKEFVIVPLDDFTEWYEDLLLAAIVEERLTRQDPQIVPFAEIEKRLDRKRKGK